MGIRRWFFGGDHYTLTSPLSIDACIERLSHQTAPPNDLLGFSGGYLLHEDLCRRPLRGKVRGATFRVARRITLQGSFSQYRLTFATWVDGAFTQKASATVVRLTTRVFRGMGCLLWVVAAAMTLVIGVTLTANPSAWPALAIPVFFVAIPVMGRLATAGDTAFLLSVLKTTLDATETPDDPA